MNQVNKAVFLDRDGTLIKQKHHLTKVEEIELIPGASTAIQKLNLHEFITVIATNQSVIARELITEKELGHIHKVLKAMLLHDGAVIDAVYYCPHHPEGRGKYKKECECRKPKPGMLFKAACDLGIQLKESFVIGDTAGDVIAGKRAGCKAVLVLTGYGERYLLFAERYADFIAKDLPEAVKWILEQE